MTLTAESWCEAVESGEYTQGTGHLRDGDAFCCFGVACDLSGLGKWTTSIIITTYGMASTTYDIGGSMYDGLPPDAVVKLLKITTDHGHFDPASLPIELLEEIKKYVPVGEEPPDCLTVLNDIRVPFPLIAKVIRARPKGLFWEEAP